MGDEPQGAPNRSQKINRNRSGIPRAGFRANDERYVERLKLSLCGCIGVLLTVLSAAVVFPVRARTRLRKSTAHILENLGNLAFQLLGEFCQVRML